MRASPHQTAGLPVMLERHTATVVTVRARGLVDLKVHCIGDKRKGRTRPIDGLCVTESLILILLPTTISIDEGVRRSVNID